MDARLIVVIGGGIAGLTFAALHRQNGGAVLVLDQTAEDSGEDGKSVVIGARSMALLEKAGIKSASQVPLSRLRVFFENAPGGGVIQDGIIGYGIAHREVRRDLLREVQRDPVRRDILHVDFLAVREDREIAAHVPLHFINAETSPGVKLQHGVFTTVENQIAVHCLPQDLPEFIEVDVGGLEVGQSIHLSAVSAPSGVRFDDIVRGNDPSLASVITVAAEKEPEPEVTETPAETGGEPAAS